MFEEGIALLVLKGGRPLLKPQTSERENEEILPSAIPTVLHWYCQDAYSVSCARILALIKCHHNNVTM